MKPRTYRTLHPVIANLKLRYSALKMWEATLSFTNAETRETYEMLTRSVATTSPSASISLVFAVALEAIGEDIEQYAGVNDAIDAVMGKVYSDDAFGGDVEKNAADLFSHELQPGAEA